MNLQIFLFSSPEDEKYLSGRNCFILKNLIELFVATDDDICMKKAFRRKQITCNQVGVHCVFCLRSSFPSTISGIQNTIAKMQESHFEKYTHIPYVLKTQYICQSLTPMRTKTQSVDEYYIQSAKKIG